MINKIIFVLKTRGWRGLTFATVNFIAVRLLGVRIIRDDSLASNPVAKRVFENCKLNYSDEGFYFLNPMPSSVQLDEYYSSLYWDSRAGKKYGVHIRDIVHFRILDEFIPEYLVSGKVFLNFGAGHGGISNLIWLKGMEVLNVEPSSLPTFYHERWRTFENITQVPDNSVDILYGSHSLEHVQDIDALKVQVSRILKPGGFMFWEVPNAKSPSNGAQNNSVDIPHTYYFEQKFFEKWFSKTVLCGAYDPCEWVDVIQDWKIYVNDIGPVIRALGQVE